MTPDDWRLAASELQPSPRQRALVDFLADYCAANDTQIVTWKWAERSGVTHKRWRWLAEVHLLEQVPRRHAWRLSLPWHMRRAWNPVTIGTAGGGPTKPPTGPITRRCPACKAQPGARCVDTREGPGRRRVLNNNRFHTARKVKKEVNDG